MKKRILIILSLLIMIVGGLFFYFDLKKQESYDNLVMEFIKEDDIEYGQEVNGEALVKNHTGELKVVSDIDTKKVRKQQILYSLTDGNITKEFKYTINIVDTKKPVITLTQDKVTIKQNEKVNVLDYVKSVSDEVDGKINYIKEVSENDNNYYTYTTDLDTSKSGTYKVRFTAVDINNNKIQKDLTVIVEEKEEVEEVVHNNPSQYNPEFTISKNKVIVINAGHQLKGNSGKEAVGPGSSTMKAKVTTGATGKYSKVRESQITLDVALKLQKELVSRGYTVYMIRTTQNVNISNQERALIANQYKPGAVISLHCDSMDDSSITGAHTISIAKDNPYCAGLYNASSSLAKNVLNEYCKETGIKNRKVSYRNDLTGLNWSTVPSIYLEMGFISNKQEDLNLTDSSFQQKCAKGIADGLDKYFN